MSKFGGIPAQQSGSQFGGLPVQNAGPRAGGARDEVERRLSKAQAEYAAEAAARKKANQDAPWYEQLGTGIKTQTGRTMLGVAELANNLTGDGLFDPVVLAEAQREADRRDAGTGLMGAVGNGFGDFRNYLPIGPAAQAVKAKTLGQAVKQSAKVGGLAGGLTGVTESTGDEESSILTNLKNAGIGTATGAGLGAALPVATTAAKHGAKLATGGANRILAGLGSDAAAQKVAYGNIARILKDQGYAPGEVAGIIDEFKSQGIDGGTLGQMLQSSDLFTREKNLLQGGGKAGRIMGEKLNEQPKQIAASILARVKEYAQPEQTAYLYKQAADLADAPTSTVAADGTRTLGQSATARELPFSLNAIEEDLAIRADELPPTVLKRIQKIIATARADGGFAAFDRAKQQLDDLYKPNSATTDQDIVNEVVLGYRRMLNDSLDRAGGGTYSAAKEAARRDMAMRDVEAAVKGAQGSSVKTALNKFFGSIEKQEEWLKKLPPAARAEFESYLESLQKVSGRFGGSDTASNTATKKVMNAETGFGFDPNIVNPQSWADRLSAPISRNVRKAQAEVTFAPDAERLATEMRKGGPATPLPSAVPRVLATEAAKGAVPPGQPPASPGVTVPLNDLLQGPPVNLPQIPGPQSSADPLMDKIAQAESGDDPNAKNPNSSASGRFQFTDDTWTRAVAKFGKELGVTLKDKSNDAAQQKMAFALARDNAKILSNTLGRRPSKGELYIAHFLGAPDATKLIRAQGSGRDAVMLFPKRVTASNRSIFFDGGRPRTVEQVYALLQDKIT